MKARDPVQHEDGHNQGHHPDQDRADDDLADADRVRVPLLLGLRQLSALLGNRNGAPARPHRDTEDGTTA